MPLDTDGMNWMTVRYTLDIQVLAHRRSSEGG